MRKISKFLLLSALIINNTSLLTNCTISFADSKTSQTNNTSKSNKILLEKLKSQLQDGVIDGSTLDELLPISLQKYKILNLINKVVASAKTFRINLLSSDKNLSQSNNSVDVNIYKDHEVVCAKINFIKVKKYSEHEINNIFNTIEKKFSLLVLKHEFKDKDLLNEQNKDLLKCKIKNIINDERIKIDINPCFKSFKQISYKINFKISVPHKNFCKTKNLILNLHDKSTFGQSSNNKSTSKPDASDWGNNKSTFGQSSSNKSTSKPDTSGWGNNKSTFGQSSNSKSTSKPDCNQPTSNRSENNHQCDELDEEKVKQLNAADFDDLIGVGCNLKNNIDDIKKRNYRSLILATHTDKWPIFCQNWYKKVKNNETTENFNEAYTILSFKVFKILEDEKKELEIIFENLAEYDYEKLNENKAIKKIKNYLLEVCKVINNKKKF